jgi:superfamily II DNA or RNA helicase/HKD family nuclease
MVDDLRPGLHEALITEALRARIERARAMGWLVEWKEVDDNTLAGVLARHIHDHARERLDGLPTSLANRRGTQVEMANRVLEVLASYGDDRDRLDPIESSPGLLLEAEEPRTAGELPRPTPRPGISLRDSVLLVNGHRDLQIGSQVALELLSADRVDLLSAFIRFAGVRMIKKELSEFLLAGGEMRVICTVYTGSTEKRALDDLVGLGAKVKVSYETAQTRLHAKAWLFERESGFHTAYVGSSNLTSWALLDGLEWNVRATDIDNPAIIARVRTTFEQYWNDPEFLEYNPRTDGDRLEAALAAQRGTGLGPTPWLSIHVEPKPFQSEILEALSAERQRGHFRNLVVAPTGTGKTWVSAFDYRRLRAAGNERVLFIAHRNEILEQSQQVFQRVLDEPSFGERFVAGERPATWDHVFASIQSIHRYIDSLQPDHFDVVIVDEFHHAEADTYRQLLDHLQPRVLLGLTATPERADGQSIFHYFDERIASEMRLWEALDQGLLCPFHYLGVADGTDLRAARFEAGRYVVSDLDGLLTGDHIRAARILRAVDEWVLDPQEMRALGFCVSVNHARFMARQFNEAGLAAEALDGDSPAADRAAAIKRLRNGDIRAIFTVDIFNEGVDIPEVDTLLLLRPTESATVFLQQLGRGLRWADGKSVLTVLDFIGQANAQYRFDVRYRALIGGTRKQIERAVEHGFPLLPPGCAIRLDEISQEIVLENLRSSIRSVRRGIVDDLRGLPATTSLPEFLEHSRYDVRDVYSKPSQGTTFTQARRDAGYLRTPRSPEEAVFAKVVGRMLQVDDEERYVRWRAWLTGDEPVAGVPAGSRDERLLWMLFGALGQRKRPLADLPVVFDELARAPEVRDELIDVLDVLRERTRLETRPIDPEGLVPVHSHASYSRYEVLPAFGVVRSGMIAESREGVMWVPAHKTDVFFVTLNKEDSDYSVTTRYKDYPISPTLFHWESQSGTSTASATGQRYIRHEREGTQILLFVRNSNDDERGESAPFLCLGPARHVSHKSDRPMQIVWELERPMPNEIYSLAKLAAG